jgi:prepilin-type processing-associated H-X9-DG protein
MMLSSTWTGGGTDYGGCIGRHQGFLLDDDQSVMLADKEDRLAICFMLSDAVLSNPWAVIGDTSGANATCKAERGWGIFGQINKSTNYVEVRDGISNTLMIGELQRIIRKTTDPPFNVSSGPVLSHDGWAIGGSPTLFTTGCPYPDDAKTRLLMNNGYFASPGSDHPGGANFGLVDGSVRFIETTIDPDIFALLGSMADRAAVTTPQD